MKVDTLLISYQMAALTAVGPEIESIFKYYTEQHNAHIITNIQYHERCGLLLNLVLVAAGVRPACLIVVDPHTELTTLCQPGTAFHEQIWSFMTRAHVNEIKRTTLFSLPGTIPELKGIPQDGIIMAKLDMGKVLGYPTPYGEVSGNRTHSIITTFSYVSKHCVSNIYTYTTLPDSGWDLATVDIYGIKMATLMQQAFTNVGLSGKVEVRYRRVL